jgi:hypothetical protein
MGDIHYPRPCYDGLSLYRPQEGAPLTGQMLGHNIRFRPVIFRISSEALNGQSMARPVNCNDSDYWIS